MNKFVTDRTIDYSQIQRPFQILTNFLEENEIEYVTYENTNERTVTATVNKRKCIFKQEKGQSDKTYVRIGDDEMKGVSQKYMTRLIGRTLNEVS